MFRFLKEKIKMLFNKRKNIIEEKVPDREVLTVKMNNNIEIEIKKDCTLSEYSKNLDKYEELKEKFIPVKVLLTTTPESFSSNTKIIKQKIYIIEKDNLKYFITKTFDKTQISQYKTVDSNIYEIKFEINKQNSKYRIVKSIHDLNYSTREVRWYPTINDKYNFFSLDKKEAYSLVKELLINLQKIDNINNVLEIEDLYIGLSLDFPFKSYSIISDDIISLASHTININDNLKHQFDIILNETKEKVGYISFDYTCNVKSKNSCGNVFYGIKKDYQNRGYATRALGLLKQVLQNSNLECNKDLYFLVAYSNEYSKKVILNNGGEIIIEGKHITDNSISKPYMLKIKI